MLKLQYFGHLMWRADSLEKIQMLKKTLMLGKIEGWRRRRWQKRRWLDGITDSMDVSLSRLQEWRTGKPSCCSPWGLTKSQTQRETEQQQSSQPCFQGHRKGSSHVWKQPVILLFFKGEISWRFPKYDNKHIHLRHSQEQVVRTNEYWFYIYLDICLHLCFLKNKHH